MSMNDYAPYADFRSPARARNRATTNLKKYYSYKALKPGQRTQPHYVLPCDLHHNPTHDKCYWRYLPIEAAERAKLPIRPLTKREFYVEAQAWPKPPRRHHAHWKGEKEWECGTNRWAKRWEDGKNAKNALKHEDPTWEVMLADLDAKSMDPDFYGAIDPYLEQLLGSAKESEWRAVMEWCVQHLVGGGDEEACRAAVDWYWMQDPVRGKNGGDSDGKSEDSDGDSEDEGSPWVKIGQGDVGEKDEDDGWDVVSCASNASEWSEVSTWSEIDREWL